MNWKDIKNRALKTAGQAAIVALPSFQAALSGQAITTKTLWAASVAFGAAFVSAAWNVMLQKRDQRRTEKGLSDIEDDDGTGFNE